MRISYNVNEIKTSNYIKKKVKKKKKKENEILYWEEKRKLENV